MPTILDDIKNLDEYFEPGSLWLRFIDKRRFRWLAILSDTLVYSFVLTLAIICFYPIYLSPMEQLMTMGSMGAAASYGFIFNVCFYSNYKEHKLLLKELHNTFSDYDDPLLKKLYYEEKAWYSRMFIGFNGLLLILVVFINFLIPSFGDLISYLTVYQVDFSVPLPTDVFFDKKTLPYYIGRAVTMAWALSFVFEFLKTEFPMVVIVSNLVASLRYSNNELKLISNTEGDWDLSRFIKAHQKSLRLKSRLADSIGFPLAYKSLYAAFVLVFFMNTAVWRFQESTFTGFIFVGYTINVLSNLFLTMAIGEHIVAQGDEIYSQLLELKWYEKDQKTKRIYNIILLTASKPLCIDYKGYNAINLETFLAICNIAYSMFTFMQSTMG